MLNIKPKTYVLTLTGVARDITPDDATKKLFTSALAIQNSSGNDLFIGDENSQDWLVPDGCEFEFSHVNEEPSGTDSVIPTSKFWVRGTGRIVVLISEGTRG